MTRTSAMYRACAGTGGTVETTTEPRPMKIAGSSISFERARGASGCEGGGEPSCANRAGVGPVGGPTRARFSAAAI